MIDKEDAESSWNSLVRNSPMITYKVAFKPKLSEVKCEKCPKNDSKARWSSSTNTSIKKPALETLQAVLNTDRQENTRSMQYLQ